MSSQVALVTGITGQDGGYLAERLLADGVVVHGVVHDGDAGSAALLQRSPDVVLHTADLRDEASLAAVVDQVEPTLVVNLAGISSVAFSWEQPVLTADVTGLGAARLLEAAWRLQDRTGRRVSFVQASSAEIFGVPERSPQDESTPVRPASPYGAAKAFAHGLVGVYRARGLRASSLVLYNHESPRRPPSFVTRKITLAAARIAAGLQDDLALGNLEARRDWGWAPDYVDAVLRALAADEGDDYVIATGKAHSVRDFVAAAFAAAGVEDWQDRVRVDAGFVRPTDAPLLVGDAGKARRQLGWAPTVAFDELVARMVEHDLAEVRAAGLGAPPEGGAS